MSHPHIGFIGLGSQGGPMAQRIAEAGFSLTVWARRREALAPFEAKGAHVADGPAALAAVCDVVCICVVDDLGVAELSDQIIPAMKPGALLIIHSTILPQSCEVLAARCAAAGVLLLDAPVSGGGQAAAAGKLTVLCGGSAEAFAAGQAVLASFAGAIVHLGPAGTGQRAKIVNNALMAAHMGLAHAALATGEGLGISRSALAELIKVSSGRSFGFEVYARLPEPAAFSHGAQLLVKDVDLLAAIAPEQPGTAALRDAAIPFLSAATGKTIKGPAQ
jgi:3-hydroxyisobutyrate dehydrogenase